MSIHRRYSIVRRASSEISLAIGEAISKHKLTYGEVTQILAGELAETAKYQIRAERHPNDPEKSGDEA